MRQLVTIPILTAAILAALPLAAQANRATRPKIERPDGPVWNVIRKNCTACHGIDDYAFYAMDKAGWSKLIEEKHKPGDATLSDADRNLLLDWLAERLAPLPNLSRELIFRRRSPPSFPIPRRSAS